MYKPVYNFIAPGFSGRDVENCCLSVSVAGNGFSVLLQSEQGQVLVLNKIILRDDEGPREAVIAFTRFMESFSWAKMPMKKKVALMDTARFTLVPFSLYENTQKKRYLELNHPLGDNDRIRDDMLKDYYAYLLYAQDEKLGQAVEEQIPGILWRHHATTVINNLAGQYNFENEIIADVRHNRFYLMAMQNGRLKFCNAFRYQSREEFAYFVLLVYKQLNISTEEVPLRLFGLIHDDSQVIQLLRRYIKSMAFGDQSVIYHGEEMDQPCCVYHFETLKTAGSCE